MLKEKLAKRNEDVGQQVNATTKWVEDAEAGLQKVMEENSKIKGI